MGTRWLWGHGAGSSACRPRVMPPYRGGSPWIFLRRADVPRDAERVQDGSCSPASPFCCRFLPSRGAERRWEEMKAAGVAACTRKAAAGAGTDPCGILCTLPRAEALQEEQATHLQAEKKDTKSPKESKPGWSCSTQSSRGGGDVGSRPCRVPPPQMSIPLKKNQKPRRRSPAFRGGKAHQSCCGRSTRGRSRPKASAEGTEVLREGTKKLRERFRIPHRPAWCCALLAFSPVPRGASPPLLAPKSLFGILPSFQSLPSCPGGF